MTTTTIIKTPTVSKQDFLRAMEGKKLPTSANGLTPAQQRAARSADLDKDGVVAGRKELSRLWQKGIDRVDRDGSAQSILALDAKGSPTAAGQELEAFLRAATQPAPNKAASKATGTPKARTDSHPRTDLTKGIPGAAKLSTISLHTGKSSKRDVTIVAEQRVKQRRWWHILGPSFDKKGSKIWNGDVARMHKEILAGKHAKGVQIQNGKITVTDPKLATMLGNLLDVYKTMHDGNGSMDQLPNGQNARNIVNEKTRQAYTWGILKLLKEGPGGKTAKEFMESQFEGGILHSRLHYNVTTAYNHAVNDTIQRSKKDWVGMR